jgi:hypothetical protein
MRYYTVLIKIGIDKISLISLLFISLAIMSKYSGLCVAYIRASLTVKLQNL